MEHVIGMIDSHPVPWTDLRAVLLAMIRINTTNALYFPFECKGSNFFASEAGNDDVEILEGGNFAVRSQLYPSHNL